VDSKQSQFKPLNILNLRDQIGQRIKSAILGGAFRPGERLVETAIAEQLDVSRAPVREALSALEQEGIVAHVPRRGYFVVEFTDKDIEEVYSLRLLLEVEALRRAIDRASQEDVAELQGLVDDLSTAAVNKDDPETIVALDMAFHEGICRLADHSRLYSAWNNLRLQTQLLIGLTSRTHYDHPDQPRVWHQRILDAMKDKDLKQALETLKDHMLDAHQRAMLASKQVDSGEEGQSQ
jgi:DNA-binding GntR family transcriptional regulator